MCIPRKTLLCLPNAHIIHLPTQQPTEYHSLKYKAAFSFVTNVFYIQWTLNTFVAICPRPCQNGQISTQA